MDDLDRRLIALLRQDGRASVAKLAAALGVSRGTVTNRMRQLEATGVIRGYAAVLRPDTEPGTVRAWIAIQVEGSHARKVITTLLGEPGIVSLHDTNGRWDLLAELNATSMAELSQILDRVRLIKGIHASETSIHLSTFR